MAQLNINLKPDFEKDLREYMEKTGIGQKSEAIRQAIREALERLEAYPLDVDYLHWIGFGLKAKINPKPRFRSEDDLWEK